MPTYGRTCPYVNDIGVPDLDQSPTKEKSMGNSHTKETALITGSSIGAIYADRLARRGYDLIVVARNEARLKSLSARLANETGRSVKARA
jgi:hypothetical protein